MSIAKLKAKYEAHGKTGTPEHMAWCAMKKRCYNVKDKDYHRYGGRGIGVCESWQLSFNSFLQDMGRRPTPQHSLDRINNDGDYEPGNCRWATHQVQTINTRLATNSMSGVKGISWRKNERRWYANIMVSGHAVRLGSFRDIEDAINARIKAEIKYFGPLL